MNATILFSTLITVIFSVSNPPPAVLKAFEQKFPKATEVKWGKENATEYEAEFDLGDTEMSANFSPDGTWLETETEISVDHLPAKVSEAIARQYPDWQMTGASHVEKPNAKSVYEVNIKSGMKKKEVVLSEDGTFIG